MVIGFKKQFVPKILTGTKIHTIRGDAHNRWRAGRRMDMATGVRTKKYNCFCKKICMGIQKITIDEIGVSIDQKSLTLKEISELAINDGFESTRRFFEWFENYGSEFSGKLIHWTDKRY